MNIASKQELTTQELQILHSEMENKKKSPAIAWLLWFLTLGIGGHHFYLGKWVAGIGYNVLNLLGWLTFWFGIGFFFWGILCIWWILDAFRINGIVARYNERKEYEIIQYILHSRQS